MNELRSTQHAARSKCVERVTSARITARDKKLRELEDAMQAEREACDQSIAAAQQEAETFASGLSKRIAAEFLESLGPLIAAWSAAPSRELAAKIAELFESFDRRSMAELGEPLFEELVSVSFCDQIAKRNPAAEFAIPRYGGGMVSSHCAAEVRAAASAGPVAMYDALLALERDLETSIAQTPPTSDDRQKARLAARRVHATRGRTVAELHAFDTEDAEPAPEPEFNPQPGHFGRALTELPPGVRARVA